MVKFYYITIHLIQFEFEKICKFNIHTTGLQSKGIMGHAAPYLT